MKKNKVSVEIKRPVSDVFRFTTNPTNTPKWVESISEEKANKFPVKVGTIYSNKNKDGVWTEYEVIEFKTNDIFTLRQKDSDYRVQYTYIPLDDNSTELIYFEWVENGELIDPFSQETLDKLKSIMEK
ncbi:SRPBCC family protein [Candidatus Aenigmatarchaeota archaeon]